MRLINCSSLSLVEFLGEPPPYAILSHVWSNEEISFQEFSDGTGQDKLGFAKVKFCAGRSIDYDLNYLWVDTCCIDQRNSAEVSESINSMFSWYRKATKCYTILSYVHHENQESWKRRLRHEIWFKSSWTLLELIAPHSIDFFSADFIFLGDKQSLEEQLHDITRIPILALRGGNMDDFSVREQLSWAQGRQAARAEDEVYSLLGLFDVHMLIMYGEGKDNALRRFYDALPQASRSSNAPSRSSMRLLMTKSNPLRLTTVSIQGNFQYGILSHTWGEDEVTFEDMRTGTAQLRLGYSKIRACCDLAAKHGLDYIWADTCCIDKASSSELQEAICSMYMWYKNATICYVYLSGCSQNDMDSFAECKWFKRGWTLQELIAPRFVEFYDQSWNEVGTKQSLCGRIAKITSIDPAVLRGADPSQRTIAERMSWAASRETTRLEDVAYSLMGLFNVFMPMLYGEGNRAFARLQEEITKQTEDYTIFSWTSKTSLPTQRGIFAHSPAEFIHSGPNMVTPRIDHACTQTDEYLPPALSSRGLVLTLPLASVVGLVKGTYLGWIACSGSAGKNRQALCIFLKEIKSSPCVFARISAQMLESQSITSLNNFELQTICVLASGIEAEDAMDRLQGGRIIAQISPTALTLGQIVPYRLAFRVSWYQDTNCLHYQPDFTGRPLALIAFGSNDDFLLLLGLQNKIPWCSVMSPYEVGAQGGLLKNSDFVIPPTTQSDRARKNLSDGKILTAKLRPACSVDEIRSSFMLHLDVLPSS